jgi:hypothetical protein
VPGAAPSLKLRRTESVPGTRYRIDTWYRVHGSRYRVMRIPAYCLLLTAYFLLSVRSKAISESYQTKEPLGRIKCPFIIPVEGDVVKLNPYG